jgi:hypothetical protein
LQYSRKHSSGAVAHVDDAQSHANVHTGSTQEPVHSAAKAIPSFRCDAFAFHVWNAEDVDERAAVPAIATFAPFSS